MSICGCAWFIRTTCFSSTLFTFHVILLWRQSMPHVNQVCSRLKAQNSAFGVERYPIATRHNRHIMSEQASSGLLLNVEREEAIRIGIIQNKDHSKKNVIREKGTGYDYCGNRLVGLRILGEGRSTSNSPSESDNCSCATGFGIYLAF